MLNNATVMKVPHILWGVNQVVHEDNIGCNVIAAIKMTLLKGNQVEEQRLGTVVDQEPWYSQFAILKFDVPEAIGLSLLELDSSLFKLCDAMYQLLPPFVGNSLSI